MSRRRFLPLAMVLLTPICPAVSRAQPPAIANEAEQRFNEGKQAIAHDDPETARRKFLQAYTLDPTAEKALWNLALAEKHSHHSLDAIRHFRMWLRRWTPSTAGGTKRRDTANDLVEKLGRETGHLVFDGPAPSSLAIDGNETLLTDDKIAVDVFDVTPGHHSIEAKFDGRALKQDVDVAAGATVTLSAPPAAAEVASPPPLPPETAATGFSSLIVEPAAREKPGSSSRGEPPAKVIVSAGLGLTGVALAVAGAFELKAAGDHDADRATLAAQNPYCGSQSSPSCAALQDAVHARNTDHNVGVALVVSGGVAIAAGVATWVFWRRPTEQNTAFVVTPWASPSGGGLGASGSF